MGERETYRLLESLCKSHVCARCRGALAVAWIDGHYRHRCECPDGPLHGFRKIMTYVEAYAQGIAIPIHVQNRLQEKLGGTMPKTDLTRTSDTNIVAVAKNLFGSLAAEPERDQAIALIKAGFDPALHLEVHHGKPWINIRGAHWWAHQRQDEIFGSIISEPIINPATREAYGVEDHQIGVIASLSLRNGRVLPDGTREVYCRGFGRASKDPRRPVIKGSAVESQHTYLMAEKRAEYKALFKYHPAGSAWASSATEEPEPDVTVTASYTVSEPEDKACPIHKEFIFDIWDKHRVVGESGPRGGKVWCHKKDAWSTYHDSGLANAYHDAQREAQEEQEAEVTDHQEVTHG